MTKKTRLKSKPLVNGRQTLSEAFAAILRNDFQHLREWETAARSWDDIEGVHQLRVACRRMRSALRVFRSAVPRAVTDVWGEEVRWLAGQLGPARDLDVFISEGLQTVADRLPLPGADKLAALVQQRREAAYAVVRAMLDGERYARFQAEFGPWLEREGWLDDLSDGPRERLTEPVEPFARKCLDRQERRVLETGSQVDPDSAPAMHALRIECKRLRYTAEFFRPLFGGMDDFIEHLKGLQDLLGVLNDVAVTHRLLDDLLAGATDPELLQYAGALVGWRTRQAFELKGQFNAGWEDFVAAGRPWWRKNGGAGSG